MRVKRKLRHPKHSYSAYLSETIRGCADQIRLETVCHVGISLYEESHWAPIGRMSKADQGRGRRLGTEETASFH